jgi:hypothetical protein
LDRKILKDKLTANNRTYYNGKRKFTYKGKVCVATSCEINIKKKETAVLNYVPQDSPYTVRLYLSIPTSPIKADGIRFNILLQLSPSLMTAIINSLQNKTAKVDNALGSKAKYYILFGNHNLMSQLCFFQSGINPNIPLCFLLW